MDVSRNRKWLFSGKLEGNIDGAPSNLVSDSVSHRVPGKLTGMVRAGLTSGDVRRACEQCDPIHFKSSRYHLPQNTRIIHAPHVE